MKQDNTKNTGNFESYSEYNKILRAWFVAFGIGGPAAILINKPIREKLLDEKQLQCVAILFLVGCAAQILIAFINKMANWYCYYSSDIVGNKTTWQNWMETLSRQFWIDIALDVITMLAFLVAIFKIFHVFCKSQ